MTEPIKIDGLAQFTRDLGKIDPELPKLVRLVNNKAADLVVDEARPLIPRRSGKAAKSLRAQSTRTAVRVTEGGKRAPYVPWLDFGGSVGKGKSVKRPFIREGRYIYKAYRAKRDSGQFEQVLTTGLIDVVTGAGIEVD